jgi:Ser/Thr protein kinase RdoA (MazF antagonist)
MKEINNFLDDKGRIKIWPAKHDTRLRVLKYIATKFEVGRFYSEKEVNALIDEWHTFGDFYLIRRGLIDHWLMSRTPNGARYWREETDCFNEIIVLVEENYSVGKIRSMCRLSGGYGSNTYYVLADKGEYIFRDIESNGMNHPENEPMIVAELMNGGLYAPQIIPVKSGGSLLYWEDKTYQLRTFSEGRIFKQNEAPEWLLPDAARKLGRIQRCLDKLPPLPVGIGSWYFEFFTPDRAEELHTYTLEKAIQRHDSEITDALCCKIKMIRSLKKAEFDFDELTCKNTHGDYKIQHLICQRDQISSVIDFTGACFHPVCFEIIRSYVLTAPDCADGSINVEHFKKYISYYLEFGTLNAYDLKLMPALFYYQNIVADYFGQYYTMDNENRHILLHDAFFSLKLCQWLEKNMTRLEDALVRGF